MVFFFCLTDTAKAGADTAGHSLLERNLRFHAVLVRIFCQRDIPHLKEKNASIIVNVCGRTVEDYVEVVERLADEPVDLLEINVSCPNVKAGGISF